MTHHHRDSLGARLEQDEANAPEKFEHKRSRKKLGWTFVIFGALMSLAALVVIVKTFTVNIPLLILLIFGAVVAMWGAHIIPSQTEKADAWFKDILDTAGNLIPGLKKGP